MRWGHRIRVLPLTGLCRFADLPCSPKWPMWQMWQVLPGRAHGDGAFDLYAQFGEQLVSQPAAQAIQLGA
jgi:hypothetical protein